MTVGRALDAGAHQRLSRQPKNASSLSSVQLKYFVKSISRSLSRQGKKSLGGINVSLAFVWL